MAKHPGSIDRHGSGWRVRLSVDGRRHTYKLDGDRPREEVEQFAREKDTELRRRSGRRLPGPMLFSDLLRRYRDMRVGQLRGNSPRTYGASLHAFETYFVQKAGNPAAHEIRAGNVVEFLEWRRLHAPHGKPRATPLKPRTLAKDRAVLHALFAYGQLLEVVEGNPVTKATLAGGDQREPIILDDKQYEALIRACSDQPMLRTYVLVLGEAGLRCDSEALYLRWEDLDLKKAFLTVWSGRAEHRTKSGKSRKVPMTPRLHEALREHEAAYRSRLYKGKRSPWVFHHELDRRHAKAGTRLNKLRGSFNGAAKRAGLPRDFRQHDLRHRRVTTWLAAGKPLALVQKAMGHASIRVTESYLHLVAEDLRALVDDPEEDELRKMVES